MRKLPGVLLPAIACLACHGAAPSPAGRPAHVIQGCSPLAVGGTTGTGCVLPFPNAWFEEE